MPISDPQGTPGFPRDFNANIAAVAALGDRLRRALYHYVARQATPVDRDEAAAGVGVPRHVAKFHLDRLESDGLLEAEFSRPPGRTGPGAGRPAKRYRRSKRELSVSLPARQYDLAGRVMAGAIEAAAQTGEPVTEALRESARAVGRALGDEAGRHGEPATLTDIAGALEAQGYEPRLEEDRIVLDNCPFHSLAQQYTDLVCGMNVDLVQGLADGLGGGVEVRLEPAPDRCCVTLNRR